MGARLTTDQVWREINNHIFAVLATVTPTGEPRTAGVVYIVRNRHIYIAIGRDSWKARNIAANPNIAMTVTVAKRIPFFPWIRIPAATISFHGTAIIRSHEEVSAEIRKALMRTNADKPEVLASVSIVECTLRGRFMAYGIGVPMLAMREPDQARGYAPVM